MEKNKWWIHENESLNIRTKNPKVERLKVLNLKFKILDQTPYNHKIIDSP
jgi:hypothetical protein